MKKMRQMHFICAFLGCCDDEHGHFKPQPVLLLKWDACNSYMSLAKWFLPLSHVFAELKSKRKEEWKELSLCCSSEGPGYFFGHKVSSSQKVSQRFHFSFNFSFSLKSLGRWCWFLSCALCSSTGLLTDGYTSCFRFPITAKGWLEAYFATSTPERLTGKLHCRQLRHTLLYRCSHNSNLFLLLLLKAYLCDYIVKAFFITFSTISHM